MEIVDFKLWSYSISGNECSGWDVIDRKLVMERFQVKCVGAMPTDEEVRLALVDGGYLNAKRRIIINRDNIRLEVTREINGCPIFGLHKL